jgi:hypothetical protein
LVEFAVRSMERRDFLGGGAALVGAGSLAGVIASVGQAAAQVRGRSDADVARDGVAQPN